MAQTVYVETSIVSYLTARPSSHLVSAARQQTTSEWWLDHRESYQLYCSELVHSEAAQGDPIAAKKRLAALDGIPLLDLTDEALRLAHELIKSRCIPANAQDDALHIALSTAHSMDYLLTWNCRHIANAHAMIKVSRFFMTRGLQPSLICTPDEMLGV